MAHISNPPLDPDRRSTRPAAHGHTAGPITNPPLDGSRSAPAHTPDTENPPLDSVAPENAPAVEELANPQLDESNVERWFEAQLGSDTVPTVDPLTPASVPSKPATTKVPTEKSATKKAATRKSTAEKTRAKKAAARKSSTKRSTGSGGAAGKRR